jgi:chromate transporter
MSGQPDRINSAPDPGADPGPSVACQASLVTVLREWGRIGCTGFGGPPAHIALLRKLCVDRQQWMDAREFEDAIAACNLLPGPASTQLAIFCAWRVRGRPGALAGGAAFIIPGLVIILALSVLFLAGTPPLWVRGAGMGAGAAVAAVAVQAGWSLIPPSWKRAAGPRRWRWTGYLLAGAAAADTIGPWLVLVLLGCGAIELAIRHSPRQAADIRAATALPLLAARAIRAAGPARALAAAAGGGVLLPVAWTAFKAGALSFGGGFVIIPLMQADAVGHHWMTSAQFLNGVALGQITPGPVVQTVATVGYAAAGIGGGLLAALVAFSPSFAFVLAGAPQFGALRGSQRAQAFLDGSGPAAIGAILGSAITLARDLTQPWQYTVLAAAAALLLGLRRGVVLILLAAAAAGVLIALAGGIGPALASCPPAGRDLCTEPAWCTGPVYGTDDYSVTVLSWMRRRRCMSGRAAGWRSSG